MFIARYGIAPMRNYNSAVAHESNIKAIRGKPHIKPIGKRRNLYATIRKDGDGVVNCTLYGTDVVRFYPTGEIKVQLGRWVTQSTINFIREVLGTHVCIASRIAWIWCTTKDNPTTKGMYALNPSGVNSFSTVMIENRELTLQFENPACVVKHKVNRKAANNVRKMYKPFKDYIVRTMRLRDEGFSLQEFGEMFGWLNGIAGALPNYPDSLKLAGFGTGGEIEKSKELLQLALSSDPQDNYKASLWLARCAGVVLYGKRICMAKDHNMLSVLDETIMHAHRDEVFVIDSVANGDIVRDPYAKFFRDQSALISD